MVAEPTVKAPGIVVLVNDQNYDALVTCSEVPVLLAFCSPWCGPCQLLAPALAAVAQKLAGRLLVGTCDPDSDWAVAGSYQIFTLPTLLVFVREAEQQREAARVVGARSARELLTLVSPFVGGTA